GVQQARDPVAPAARPSAPSGRVRAGDDLKAHACRELVDGAPRLGARDRIVMEARKSQRDLIDLVVEPAVWNHPVHIAVLGRARRSLRALVPPGPSWWAR